MEHFSLNSPRVRHGGWMPFCSALTLFCLGGVALAEEPLHRRIDALIAAQRPDFETIAAPVASDAEFLRRVSLDLTGTLPATQQTRAFLADPDGEKRVKLVDRLLKAPEYARHMQRVFDVILMRRLPEKTVKVAEWETFLRESFAENKPWDRITREILAADGSDSKNRGPARFFLARDGDVNKLTRDIGRIFLGADLECAQCHSHPEIDDYKQEHYYGISAFLVRSFVFTDKKNKMTSFAEKGVGEVSFESVFDVRDKISKGPKSTMPRLFSGKVLEEPKFKKDEEYKVKPAKGVRPVPKFSRRSKLPETITSPENKRFARTAANRLWAVMLGRGLIEPVDLDHSGNPPSHPELLELLTDELMAHNYDVKWFLRQAALSKTYQRSSRRNPQRSDSDELGEELFAQAILKPLSPAQLAWSLLQATGESDLQREALGDKQTEEALHEKLVDHENKFVRLFGGLPGKPPENFESTVDQVLFLANDNAVLDLIAAKNGNLAGRLAKLSADHPQSLAEELFLSVLVRPPGKEDVNDVEEYLAARTGKSRTVAIQELIWALIASSEFRFNH